MKRNWQLLRLIALKLRKSLLEAGLMTIVRDLLFPLLWLGYRIGRGDCMVVMAKKKAFAGAMPQVQKAAPTPNP